MQTLAGPSLVEKQQGEHSRGSEGIARSGLRGARSQSPPLEAPAVLARQTSGRGTRAEREGPHGLLFQGAGTSSTSDSQTDGREQNPAREV